MIAEYVVDNIVNEQITMKRNMLYSICAVEHVCYIQKVVRIANYLSYMIQLK